MGKLTKTGPELVQVIKRKEIKKFFPDLESVGWGGFAPERAKTMYAARSIWNSFQEHFDIVPNRRTYVGSEEATDELHKWLWEEGHAMLNKAFLNNDIRGSSDEYVLVKQGKFVMLGTPNQSHGYAYISAWVEEGT
jgi:hypothetical protein